MDKGAFSRRQVIMGAAAAGAGLVMPVRFTSPAKAAGLSLVAATATIVKTDVAQELEVAVVASGAANIRVSAWPTDPSGTVLTSPWSPTNAANAAKIRLAAAGPGWSYQAEVAEPGATIGILGPVQSVVAWPAPGTPSQFTIAHGSCTSLGRTPALSLVGDSQALFFGMLGDMGYVDGLSTQNYALYANTFVKFLSHVDARTMLAKMPLMGMQDDHDYGRDGCFGAGATDGIVPFAAQAFADLVPGAAFPAPTYRSWSIGQADFWLVDNRRYSTPASATQKTLLGTTQKQWLMDGLMSSTARVKFVLAPMTVAWFWRRVERIELLDFIEENVSGKVIFLTGDKHAAGIVEFVNVEFRTNRAWEMLAGPLNNPSKHLTKAIDPTTGSIVHWTEAGSNGRARSNIVGFTDIDTLSATPHVTLRVFKDTGVEPLYEQVISL